MTSASYIHVPATKPSTDGRQLVLAFAIERDMEATLVRRRHDR